MPQTSTQNSVFRPPRSKLVTFWAVSRTYPIQLNCTDSRDRGPGGISSEDFPSWARSAFVHNVIVRSLSHGEVTWHRPWTFPFVYQDLKSPQETPITTIEFPDEMYPTILYTVKCPMIRPQRYIRYFVYCRTPFIKANTKQTAVAPRVRKKKKKKKINLPQCEKSILLSRQHSRGQLRSSPCGHAFQCLLGPGKNGLIVLRTSDLGLVREWRQDRIFGGVGFTVKNVVKNVSHLRQMTI